MKITEELLEAIKILGEYQMGKLVYASIDTSPLIGFENEESGTLIINPFLDDCGWATVNPIEYYGEEFLNSDFLKIDINTIGKYKETEIIAFCDCEKMFVGSSYDFLDANDYQEEVEAMVLEAAEKGYVKINFFSGEWEIYTKEAYEKLK